MYTCNSCRLMFPSWDRLKQHKAELFAADQGHIHCYICLMDFCNSETLIRHYQTSHGKKQDLNCPGCGEHFTRASGLVGHVESHQCAKIKPADLESHRKEKLRFGQQLNKLDPNRPGVELFNYAGIRVGDTSEWNMNALRHPRSNHVVNPVYFEPNDFLSLGPSSSPPNTTGSAQSGVSTGEDKENTDAWGQPKNLFPAAAAAEAPTPDHLASAASQDAKTEHLMAIHDPNHPHFNAEKYKGWNGRYKCPVDDCFQSAQTAEELATHLKLLGPHGKKQYRCPSCQRSFVNMTAIMQHAENPGRRCRIGHSENGRIFLDQLTAGLVDVTGSHDDMSLKFEVTNEAVVRYGQAEKPGNRMTAEERDAKQQREREQYLADRTWED